MQVEQFAASNWLSSAMSSLELVTLTVAPPHE